MSDPLLKKECSRKNSFLINKVGSRESEFKPHSSNNYESSSILSSALRYQDNHFKFPEVNFVNPQDFKTKKTTALIQNPQLLETSQTFLTESGLEEDHIENSINEFINATIIPEHKKDLNIELRGPRNDIHRTNQSSTNNQIELGNVRLKSISLDSDCAKLVEINLGIPVENLIEINHQTQKQNKNYDYNVYILEKFVDHNKINKNNDIQIKQNYINDHSYLKNIEKKSENHSLCKCKSIKNVTIKKYLKDNSFLQKTNKSLHLIENIDKHVFKEVGTKSSPTSSQIKARAVSLDSCDIIIDSKDCEDSQFLTSLLKSSRLKTSKSMPTTPYKSHDHHLYTNDKNRFNINNNVQHSKQKNHQKRIKEDNENFMAPVLTDIEKRQIKSLLRTKNLRSTCSLSADRQQSFLSKLCSFNKHKINNDYKDLADDDLFLNVDDITAIEDDSVFSESSSNGQNNIFMNSVEEIHDENNLELKEHRRSRKHFLTIKNCNDTLIHDNNSHDNNINKRSMSLHCGCNNFEIYNNFSIDCNSLLGPILKSKKTSALSLSNNNLKTLPEVMTLSNFFNDKNFIEHNDETQNKSRLRSSVTSVRNKSPNGSSIINTNDAGSCRIFKNSILHCGGLNQSLTINLNKSLDNLTKSLSVSSYSLGSSSQSNFSSSNYNLTNSKMIPVSGKSNELNDYFKNNFINEDQNIQSMRKHIIPKSNLLQRRGSNTSLTLNLCGSSCMDLDRFSSHSSLNMLTHNQLQHHENFVQQQPINNFGIFNYCESKCDNQLDQQIKNSNSSKKGLLERRNSNTSLTLNILQKERDENLSIDNLHLSTCSLNTLNINVDATNNSENQIINTKLKSHNFSYTRENYNTHNQAEIIQRKFLSYESLNNKTQCSKLNQTHERDLTKTCFGSVSDLKPYHRHLMDNKEIKSKITYNYSKNHNQLIQKNRLFDFTTIEPANFSDNYSIKNDNNFSTFVNQTNLCSCTGVRNITTRPLSPQSTSEDFKMYLANVQFLQNATNMLNIHHLRKLYCIFQDFAYTSKIISSDIPTKTETVEEKISTHLIDFNVQSSESKKLILNLHQEFWSLPTNHQEKPLVFGSQSKNRYRSILPNEHSRVLLFPEQDSSSEPYINANYIKGPDYTQNSYIAAQGPMQNTLYEYWLLVYQNIQKYNNEVITMKKIRSSLKNNKDEQKSSSKEFDKNLNLMKKLNFSQKIIMLTDFIETNRQKCSQYFPIHTNDYILITEKNDIIHHNCDLFQYFDTFLNDEEKEQSLTKHFDNFFNPVPIRVIEENDNLLKCMPKCNFFIIKNTKLSEKICYKISKFVCVHVQTNYLSSSSQLNNQLKIYIKKFYCHHYWFPDWPDHHSPSNINSLLDMCLKILNNEKLNEFDNQPLPIIHCSAGIGRTGCFIAILNGICQMILSSKIFIKLNSIASTSSESTNFSHKTFNCDKSTRYIVQNNSKMTTKCNSNFLSSLSVDVLAIVCNLRLQRGGMVQNSEQYELIHRAICLYLWRLESMIMK